MLRSFAATSDSKAAEPTPAPAPAITTPPTAPAATKPVEDTTSPAPTGKSTGYCGESLETHKC